LARGFASRNRPRAGRRESSVEEALVEMHLAGVSVRRVEVITEALGVMPRGQVWGVAAMLKAIYAREGRPATEAKAAQVVEKLTALPESQFEPAHRAAASADASWLQ
jgi:hypothetical protein